MQRFLFRVRDRTAGDSDGDPDSGAAETEILLDRDGFALGPAVGRHTVFWNCFVLYSQRMLVPAPASTAATATGLDLLCESLVLVTRWPCLELAHQMLSR